MNITSDIKNTLDETFFNFIENDYETFKQGYACDYCEEVNQVLMFDEWFRELDDSDIADIFWKIDLSDDDIIAIRETVSDGTDSYLKRLN